MSTGKLNELGINRWGQNSSMNALEVRECSQVWWAWFLWFYFVPWISMNPKEKWVNTSHIFHRQYQDFLEDLEEDETIRKNVNIYRSKAFLTASLGVTKSCLNHVWGKILSLNSVFAFSKLPMPGEMLWSISQVCFTWWVLFPCL